MDLKSRIDAIVNGASLDKYASSTEAQRSASSSIGTETPLSVLCEIRELQAKLVDQIATSNRLAMDREAADAQRHEEMCKLLLATAEIRVSRPSAESVATGTSISKALDPKVFYYGSTEIKNGAKMLACILMHIDSMLVKHPVFQCIRKTDSVHLEFKDWCNYCSYALNCDPESKVGLRIPKNSDTDYRSAGSISASPYVGRHPQLEESHIAELLDKCSEIMNTVEWLRKALTRCTGVLSSERTYRLTRISHPYIDSDMNLNVERAQKVILPRKAHCSQVAQLKATELKAYMSHVLALDMKPSDALAKVKQDFKKV